MRVVTEIPHPQCKITVFSWNGKYLIKLEAGPLEQTYKVSEWDLTGEDDIKKLLSEEFINAALNRFEQMHADFSQALQSL
jgi:hypothetical protein